MILQALFVIFEKSNKILKCSLLQIIGGTLRNCSGILLCQYVCSQLALRQPDFFIAMRV